MARRILANSPGWKLIGPMHTQIRAPLMVAADAGHERQQQQGEAERSRTCSGSARGRGRRRTTSSVAMKAPMPTAIHTDCRPARPFGLGLGLVEADDEHVAEAVEQGGEGQQHAVGVRGQPADGEVGGELEARARWRGTAPMLAGMRGVLGEATPAGRRRR